MSKEDHIQDQLINLFDALRYLPAEKRAPILSDARILETDFDDLCREAVSYLNGDAVSDYMIDNFESELESYIEEYFFDMSAAAQLNILKLILKKYDALEASDLQQALEEAEINYIAAVKK